MTVSTCGLPPVTGSTRSIRRVAIRCARSMSRRMREPPSMASICFKSPKIASIRSIRRAAVCSRQSRRPAAAVTSGLAWAEGTLWVGQYRDRKIHQIDPETGALLRTIESNRFVTGVTWIDGELWHATWDDEESDVRRIDPETGEVLESLEMPHERRLGARIQWRRSVLLRWRQQRDGKGNSPAQARCRGAQRLRAPARRRGR